MERKPTPALKVFAERLIGFIQTRCKEKPLTIEFYASRLANLLKLEPLAPAGLDAIAGVARICSQRCAALTHHSFKNRRASLRRALVDTEEQVE